jgi:uncharacterized membrane protein YkoI
MKSTVLFFALCFVALSANAQEMEIKKADVPKPVIEAFEKAHASAKDVKYEKEMRDGKPHFFIEYKESGMEKEFIYAEDGTLVEMELEIAVKDLPANIAEAVKKDHPKGEIIEVEKVMKADGTLLGYEVDIKEGDVKKISLYYDTTGKLLRTHKG